MPVVIPTSAASACCASCKNPCNGIHPSSECPNCHTTKYCSAECSESHWIIHRTQCSQSKTSAKRTVLGNANLNTIEKIENTNQDVRNDTSISTVQLDRLVVRAQEKYDSADYATAAQIWGGEIIPSLQNVNVGLPSADKSVFYTNASVAHLKAGDPIAALEFAKQAVQLRRASWPLLRYGEALIANNKLHEAVQILYEAQFVLPPEQAHTVGIFQDAIATALGRLHPYARIAWHDTYERCLVACEDVPVGTVVLQEEPLLRWDCFVSANTDGSTNKASGGQSTWRPATAEGDGLGEGSTTGTTTDTTTTNTEVVDICKRNGFSPNIADILPAFVKAPPSVQRLILTCVCPALPIGDALLSLVTLSTELAQLQPYTHLGTETVLKLLMINKVNAHRVQDNEACIFLLASKFTHSCSPNCLYDGYNLRFTTLRDIKRGELLTFSYFGGMSLLQSSEVRQVYLSHTHLFICRCHRCCDVDYARGIKCVLPCRGTRYRTGTYQLDALACRDPNVHTPWICAECKRVFRDQDMPLLVEDKLELTAMNLEGSKSKIDKNQFESIKGALLRCMSELGTSHWVYTKLISLIARYHINIARRVSRTFREQSIHYALQWGKKYLDSLDRQRVTKECSILSTEYTHFLFESCQEYPKLRMWKVKLAAKVYPHYAAVFPDRVDDLKVLQDIVENSTLLKPDPNALCHPDVEVEEDEGGLLTTWEELLTTKYVQALSKTTAQDDAPQAIHSILQEGKLPEIKENNKKK